MAPVLQSAVQKFGKSIVERLFKRQDLLIYCDRTDLNVSPGLWTSIQSQLAACSHLILLASPEAAQSIWVSREVEAWLSLHDGSVENLSIVLTGGEIAWDSSRNDFDWERTTALPQPLRGRFGEEPKYEDARALRGTSRLTLRNPAFEDVVASLAARLRRKSKRELIGQELRQQRKQRRILTAIAATMSVLAALAFYQYRFASQTAAELVQTNKKLDTTNTSLVETNVKLTTSLASEEKARQLAIQRQLAAQAELMLNQRPAEVPQSVMLAIESLGGRGGASSLEAYQTLERGLDLLPQEVHHLTLAGEPEALSLGGSRLLTATRDVIEIWDTKSFRRLLAWRSAFPITDAQISQDGTRMVVAGAGTLRVLEIAAPGAPKDIGAYGVRPDHHVAFSPTGKLVASTTLGSTFRAFTVGERAQLREGSHPGILAVAFSADESFVISGGRNGIVLSPLKGGRAATCSIADVTHVAFSRNGNYVATAQRTGVVEVRRLDPNAAQACTSPRSFPHQGRLTALSVSDDGRYVGVSSYDGTARLWDLTRGREVARGTDKDGITHIAVDGPQQLFWTAGPNKAVRLWAVQPGREYLRHSEAVRTVAFQSPDRIVTATEGGVRLVWRSAGSAFLESGDELQSVSMGVPEEPYTFGGSAASPDGKVTAMIVDTAYVWRANDRDALEFSIDLDDVTATAVSAALRSGTYFAAGNSEEKVEIHKAEGGALYRRFDTDGAVTAMAFDPQSRTLVAGTDNGVLHVWPLQGRETPRRRKVGTAILSLVVTPDGNRIVAGTKGDGVLVLDAGSLAELQRYASELSRAVAVSPDSRHVAAAGRAGVIRIWDLDSQNQLGEIVHSAGIHSLAFSPDGSRLAAGAEDQLVAVFFWKPGDLVSAACSRLKSRYGTAPEYGSACGR